MVEENLTRMVKPGWPIGILQCKKRSGKTVSISIDHASELNDLLDDLNMNTKSLHLVLVGHANEESDELANMKVEDILQACKRQLQINHILLIGCSTAKSRMPLQEKEMVGLLKEKIEGREKNKYGLQTIINAPVNHSELQEKCLVFCKKNKLNGVYLVSKDDGNHYRLIAMKMESSGKITEKIKVIPDSRIKELNNKFNFRENSFQIKNRHCNTDGTWRKCFHVEIG